MNSNGNFAVRIVFKPTKLRLTNFSTLLIVETIILKIFGSPKLNVICPIIYNTFLLSILNLFSGLSVKFCQNILAILDLEFWKSAKNSEKKVLKGFKDDSTFTQNQGNAG